jgi:AmmeMemoRadiSam system protein B
MTMPTETELPRLRAVDIHPIVHEGRASLMLRDPLQLSDKTVVIPQGLAPLLALCDGTRDSSALRASLGVRFGLRVGSDVLERLLAAFDEAFLLDNGRFAQARERALAEYREAPFRPPSCAGRSYPADAGELRRLLRHYLDAVDDDGPTFDGGRGLVSPHIDYARGGPVYAQVWKRAAGMVREAELVVLLGTDHFGADGGLTLTRQHYGTPFGVLPTARGVVDALADAVGAEAAFADELHHRSEHSIELAAVWLHHVREGRPCELVPILCGSFGHFVQGRADPEDDPAMGGLVDALRRATAGGRTTAGRRAIVVAAADLSHVGPAFGGRPVGMVERARLRAADDELIEHMCAGDAGGFFAAIKRVEDRNNVCGLPPITLALRVLDPVQGQQVAYDRCPADQNGTSWVSICGILFQ